MEAQINFSHNTTRGEFIALPAHLSETGRAEIDREEKIQLFRETFAGRDDCYGGEGRGCVKEPISDDVIWNHLTGRQRIGVYPIFDEKMSLWCSADLDDGDLEKAKKLYDRCGDYGISAYIERSKSKGFHVWLWFADPVEARLARELMSMILAELGFEAEVFPKQDSLSPDKPYGNFIYLPLFGIETNHNGRTVFLDPENNHQPYPSQWDLLRNIDRVTLEKISDVLSSHQSLGLTKIKYEAAPANGRVGGMDKVLECDFIKHCRDNASQLPEPLWYAMVSNLCRFERGRERIHEFSQPYPGYSETETDAKIEHALNDTGPHTCEWIRENGFECPQRCGVKSPAGLAYPTDTEFIPLARIEDAEFEGKEITTELMIAGIGYTYGVPREVTISWQEKDGDKAVDKTGDFTVSKDSRILLDCFKQGDYQLRALLQNFLLGRRPDAAKVKIHSRYTLRELLVVPKIQRWTDGNSSGDYDYKNFIVYYVDEADPDEAGLTIRSNVFYQAGGIALSEPKRQLKTMLVTDLEQMDSPWQSFRLTSEIQEQFHHFQPDDSSLDSIRKKLGQITGDVTRNITRRYGEHRERMLLVHLLALSSPISCCFDGERKPGWLEIMIIGDTAQAKTTLLQNLLKAINLGQLVGGSSTSRTGLIYSLDTKVNEKRVLIWGAFPHNNGGFLAVDEAHKLSAGEWSELTEVRSNGEIDVNRAVRGRHPAEVRQVYLANPPSDRPMSHFYCGIEAIKGMMRAEDIRRFDLIMIVAKGDDEDGEFLKLDSERDTIPQVFTPELLRHHVCWAWQLNGDDVEWTPEAAQEVQNSSQYLYEKYSGSIDIPLVVNDIRDKVCKLAQALASLLHSTTDSMKLRVLPEHVQIVRDDIFDAVYSHDNCRLDEYATNARRETELTDDEYIPILEDIKKIQTTELDSTKTDTLLETFRDSHLVSLGELAEILDVAKSTVSKRISILKKHGLVKSSKRGYYKTPKFVTFLRRTETNRITMCQDENDENDRNDI